MDKKTVLIIVGAFGIVAAVVMLFLSLTSGSREAARNFVIDATAGNYETARTAMHPELARQFPLEKMTEMFGATSPYTDVSFSSINAQNSRTTLVGTAETANGCASQVDITLLSGDIIAFEITPLCRQD